MTRAPVSATPALGAPATASAVSRLRALSGILTVFGGNIGAMLLGFVANVWAMRAVGPEQYGAFSVALVILFVVWQFTGKGLDQAAVCLSARARNAGSPATVFGSAYALKLIGNALLVLAGIALARPLAAALIGPQAPTAWLILAFSGAAGASLWGFASAAIQAESRFGSYAVVQAANNALRIAAMGAVALLGRLSVGTLLLAAVAGFFGAAVLGIALGPGYTRRPRWDAAAVASIWRFSRWTLVSSIVYLLYSRLDVLMLSWMQCGAAVGVYAAALTIIQILDLVTASSVTFFLPHFSQHTALPALRAQVRTALGSSLLLALPFVPGYLLIDPGVELLVRLVGAGYAGIAPLLKIMYFGVLFSMITHPVHIFFYARGRPQVLTALDFALLALIAAGNYFAIGRFGPAGAAGVVFGSRVLLGILLLGGVWLELSGRWRRAGEPGRD